MEPTPDRPLMRIGDEVGLNGVPGNKVKSWIAVPGK
jgi:hypothetical protein